MRERLLQSRNDAFHRPGEIRHRDRHRATPRRQHRRLVAQIGQVGAGKARRQRGDLVQLHVIGQLQFLQVDAQDLDAPLLVRPIHQHLPIEPSGAHQRGIKDLRPVGRRQDDDRHRAIEPVHLRQQLIERLLLLVLPAHRRWRRGRGPARPVRR